MPMKRVQNENGNHESLLGLETHLRLKPQVIVYIYITLLTIT